MLQRYRIFKPKAFESSTKFENRLNEEVRKGWRVINMVRYGSGFAVLLEREA